MSAIRRSTRERRPIHSIYEEQARESLSSTGSRSRKHKLEQHLDDEETEVINEALSSDEEEESEAEETQVKEPKRVRHKRDEHKKGKSTVRSAAPRSAPSKSTKYALAGLAKNILHADETPESSLFAGLLLSRDLEKGCKKRAGKSTGKSLYSEKLAKIIRRFIRQYNEDMNAAQVALFNLIFRSVGGSFQSLIDPQEADLENLTEEDWENFISRIISDMQNTPPDQILLSADPKVVHQSALRKSKAISGAAEYRQIYEEFWHELAAIVMSDNTTAQPPDEDENASNSEDIGHPRFRVEMIRDIVARLVEIVAVGQPDIRMASSIAVYQIGIAAFEHTVELRAKVAVANRQLSVAQRSKMARRAEVLNTQIDGWKRTIDDVESTVKETVLGVFVRRYRDSNCYIRAESLRTLSKLAVIRPDLFLVGAYLKYLAWMMSDKDAYVRIQAIQGLLAPFQQSSPAKIDTSPMTQVIVKFLPRLADCVIDRNADVQEVAMEFLLVSLRGGFLDNLDDDRIWDQINLRALAPEASFSLRRNALYFVLDQLEAFDSGKSSELRDAVEKINGLVNWMAHVLSDGNIPVDHVKYELADLLIHSLRSMPEHNSLATNWTALLSALEAESSTQGGPTRRNAGELRLDTVRRRLLLRMIVCAAELEIKSSKNEELTFLNSVDNDLVEATSATFATDGHAMPKMTKSTSLEEMNLELLSALPRLLDSFKGDNTVLRSLTTIPKYLVPSVLNLPSRKKDAIKLLAKLSDIFLVTVDLDVLRNCCLSLVTLSQGEHSRAPDAKISLKKMATKTQSKLETLYNEKTSASDQVLSSSIDIQQGIGLCMKRMAVLSKRWYVADLLWDSFVDDAADDSMDELCTLIGEDIWSELASRKASPRSASRQVDDVAEIDIPQIWKLSQRRIHLLVAEYVAEAFSFLLSSMAWRLNAEIKRIELSGEPADLDVEKHIVSRMKLRLEKLVLACFDMFLDPSTESGISEDYKAFSTCVQACALRVACDVRTLFPAQWNNSTSKLLSSLATTGNSLLEGCIIRYFKTQGTKIRSNEELDIENKFVVRTTLLPLARAVTCNWHEGSRLEAAMMLRHILGSGQEAAKLVSSASSIMKKVDPIRLLESHMACLRVGYGDWEVAEPIEPDSDRPSEEEMERYEEEKREHDLMFDDLEQLAGRLSGCLGVGKLGDRRLESSLLGFLREGIRFAFDTNEDAPLGVRLPFLILVGKYLKWVRRNKSYLDIIWEDLDKREFELRNDDEFSDVLDSDLRAIETFRRDGNLGEFRGRHHKHTEAGLTNRAASSKAVTSRPRVSIGSSVSSIRSKVTGQTTLTPVNEEDMTVEDEESSPAATKRRKVSSPSASLSTMDHTDAGSIERMSDHFEDG